MRSLFLYNEERSDTKLYFMLFNAFYVFEWRHSTVCFQALEMIMWTLFYCDITFKH